MVSSYYPLQRSERIIALGRVTLAAFSLLAIWLDPTTPAKYAETTYTLLAAYLGYAVVLLLMTWTLATSSFRLGVTIHVVDFVTFTVFLVLTEGSTSPLFVYFMFALLAAALRWRWRGVLWTAAAALVIFVGLGAYVQWVLRDPAFQLNRFVIRTVYLVTAALLLGYLSAYEQRLRGELAKLAAWPRSTLRHGSPLQVALGHAAGILGAPRALMAWEEADEPWRYLATYADGEFRCVREPAADPGAGEPPVAEPLADADFLCPDARRADATVLFAGPAGGGLRRWQGAPLCRDLRERFGVRSVLGLRLRGESFEGRLFVLDLRGPTADDLVLGGVVARQLVADLNQFYLQQRLQQAAVAEERARFARDLHDGVLQSLTGLALQLKVLERLIATDPPAARRHLADLQALVAAEQSDLRFFVRQMKPVPLSRTEINAGLIAHLKELAARTERRWGLRVELTVGPLTRQLSETLAHGIYRILQEALANAARHGGATVARVDLAERDDELHLTVADGGRGFPFRGRHDLAALAVMHQGPASLKERVASLGGGLTIDSSESGARLEIALPLRPALRGVADDAWARAPPAGGDQDAAPSG